MPVGTALAGGGTEFGRGLGGNNPFTFVATNQLGEGAIADIPELRQKWEALENRYTDHLTNISPDALEETVARYILALKARLTLRRSDALLHICTHFHYTVAQVVNMLRQLGATLPQTMLIALFRQEST